MRICVIHTGGTIGSDVTDTGFAPRPGLVEDCLAQLASQGHVQASYDIVLADPLIDSSQAQTADWNWICAAVMQRYDHYDGFVVVHGTDSLGFAAAALAFALDGLAKPVVVTGSMVPLSVADSDGAENLIGAMAAASSAAPGVWVQFAGQLLPGTRVQKIHSQAHAAFAADRLDVSPRIPAEELACHSYRAQRIAVITLTPGIDSSLLQDMCQQADAVILRCFGSGNVPGDAAFRAFLQGLNERDIPVLAISQCAAGGIVMGTYSAGALLVEAGVCDGKDMTLEAAYTKLMMGLSCHSGAAVRQYLETPMAGEITN